MQQQLLLEYSYLADGETAAGQLCPSCRGGRTGETTLSVSRDGDTLLWVCHRASCGFSGRSGSRRSMGMGGGTKVPTCRGTVGRTYVRGQAQLPTDLVALLKRKYYLNNKQLVTLGWAEELERVVLPVRDWQGELLGSVLRSESGVQPKAKSHTEEDAVACYVNYSSSDCIIVEDCYSALRASEYMNAVALLGTNLNDSRVRNIKQQGFKNVYLALDADVYDKVIRYVQQYRSLLRMIPVKLECDLKNHSVEELKEFMNGLQT